ANIHEGEGVGPAFGDGGFHFFERLLALEGGVEFVVAVEILGRRRGVAEELGFLGREGFGATFGTEDFAKVVVDGATIVDDENALMAGGHRSAHEAGREPGSSRVNVAPWPRPSLWARREPPISWAARALLWRPKP